jgi:hypothetical protein
LVVAFFGFIRVDRIAGTEAPFHEVVAFFGFLRVDRIAGTEAPFHELVDRGIIASAEAPFHELVDRGIWQIRCSCVAFVGFFRVDVSIAGTEAPLHELVDRGIVASAEATLGALIDCCRFSIAGTEASFYKFIGCGRS